MSGQAQLASWPAQGCAVRSALHAFVKLSALRGCLCLTVDTSCRGRVYRVHSFDYQGHVVWGLTAAMLIQVAELALGRPPDFEVDHPSNVSTSNQSRM
jgi:hypothetical protein